MESNVSMVEICISKGTDTTHEYINQITINQIDNISGNNDGYGDFQDLSTPLFLGNRYDILLSPGYGDNEFTEAWSIWIDYNQDGDFEDEDEEVLTVRAVGDILSEIHIPYHAMIGTTHMRIAMRYNKHATPCQTFTFGEVEDYTIIISDEMPCTEVLQNSFEDDYGIWIDGGDDCTRVREHPKTGEWSVRLRDDTGASSSMTTQDLSLADVDETEINFSYYPNSMEDGEKFSLLISTDGGQVYTNLKTWESGRDFTNGSHYTENILISDVTFTNQTRIRIMCDASANADQIFIDDISITKCNSIDTSEENYQEDHLDYHEIIPDEIIDNNKQKDQIADQKLENITFEIYPNPTHGELSFISHGTKTSSDTYTLRLMNLQGDAITTVSSITNIDDYTLDVSSISNGMYFLLIEYENIIVDRQKILVSK